MAIERNEKKVPTGAFFSVEDPNFYPWLGNTRVKFDNKLLHLTDKNQIQAMRSELDHWSKYHGLKELTEKEYEDLKIPALPEGMEDGSTPVIVEMPKSDLLAKLLQGAGKPPEEPAKDPQ